MFAGPRIPIASAVEQPELDQLAVVDRHALDRLAALRLDHRARDRVQAAAVEVAEDVDRELLAAAHELHHRVGRRVREEEVELARGRPPGRCGASRSPRAPSTSTGNGRSSGSSAGSQVSGDGMPCSQKKTCARYLSFMASTTSGSGSSTSAGSSSSRRCARQPLVEVGERHDEPHVVQVDELGERRDVGGVVDPRHERVHVGVVERRRERVRVDGDGSAAGAAERGDDVDALPGAREQDCRHGRSLAVAEGQRLTAVEPMGPENPSSRFGARYAASREPRSRGPLLGLEPSSGSRAEPASSRRSRPCTCRRRGRAGSSRGSSGRAAASGAPRTRRRARSGRPTAASRGRGPAPSR